MYFKITIYSFVFQLACLCSTVMMAQGTYQLGTLTIVNASKTLKKDWSASFNFQSRQLYQQGAFGGVKDKSFDYVLTDFTFIASKKISKISRLAGGYLYRVRGDDVVHRTIQQLAITKRLKGYKLVHRLVTDQTFINRESPEFRLRYRWTTEIPFGGKANESGKFYFKCHNEYVNSIQSANYDLEVRLIPLIGCNLSDIHSLDVGLDYRVRSFLSGITQHIFWMNVNCSIGF